MPYSYINLAPGIYTEQTPSGAVNRWKDCDHVRFRNGQPEKIGGWQKVAGSFVGKARALHDWVSLDNLTWIAIGTSKKLFLYNNGTYYDITPYKAGSLSPFFDPALTNPFDTTIGSDIVQVTHLAEAVNEGDYVHFSNASAVGGITIDGEYEVQSVLGGGVYTIQHSSAATSTANGGGTVDWMYEISTVNDQFGGWGAGYWGSDVWSGSQETGALQRIRLWSLENWGEDLIANPRDGAVYWWDRTNGPNTRAVVIPNAPSEVQRIIVSGQDRHLIAIGADDPLNIAWCSQEDFNTWTPAITNTAGDKRLDNGSELITAIRSRGEIVLFTDIAVLSMSFEGPPLVFGFYERGEALTIISPNAASEINGVVYFMCNSDFMVYDGLLRILPCDVRNHVFDRLNTMQKDKVYSSVNQQHNEVWWFFPADGELEPNDYVVYNYVENCWYYGTLDRTAMHDASPVFGVPYAAKSDSTLWMHEIGVDEVDMEATPNITAIPSYLNSYDSQIGEGDFFVQVRRFIPDFLVLNGSLDITLGAKPYPAHDGYVEKGPYNITDASTMINTRIRGRQMTIGMATSDIGDWWRLGTFRVDGVNRGRRGGGSPAYGTQAPVPPDPVPPPTPPIPTPSEP